MNFQITTILQVLLWWQNWIIFCLAWLLHHSFVHSSICWCCLFPLQFASCLELSASV